MYNMFWRFPPPVWQKATIFSFFLLFGTLPLCKWVFIDKPRPDYQECCFQSNKEAEQVGVTSCSLGLDIILNHNRRKIEDSNPKIQSS